MIKIIIIIINPTANDHDSGDDNDEIQVQDQEESGIINMSSSSMTSMDLSKNKTNKYKPMQPVIKYPPTKFGSTNRSFQSRWYEQFP